MATGTLHSVFDASAALVAATHSGAFAEAEARVVAALTHAPVRTLAALDRAFRDRGVVRRLGLAALDPSYDEGARVVRSAPATEVLGVLSMVRNGHLRELALSALGGRTGPWATAFIVVRANDYVAPIARAATAALSARLDRQLAPEFLFALPLVTRSREWVRAGREALSDRVHALLARHPDVLAAGFDHGDPEVRREALRVAAALRVGTEGLREVLARALAERDPVTRRWAASFALDRATTPEPVLAALLPVMSDDRSPDVRLAALRAWRRRGEHERVVRMAFDRNADVRFRARRALKRAGVSVPYRARALELLADRGSAAVIGALATLSEFGTSEDRDFIASFLTHALPPVRREATRTLERIG